MNIKIKKLPNTINVKDNLKGELNKEDLKEINNEMKKKSNYFNIFRIVTKISKYFISDNEINIKNYNKNKKSILIIGGGPIGLFLSCYLKITYTDVNVILIDNRINRPGFRKPYTRVRPFSTSSKYLSLIVPKLYCMTENEYLNMINIFVLEYLLYSKAILEYNIPMLYKDYDWEEYKKFMVDYNVDVVFDCTGGKLKTNIFKNINSSWIKNTVNKDIKKQLMIINEKNIVHLVDYPKEKKFKLNHFYGSLNIYDKNMMFVEKNDIDIMNEEDLIFLNKIKKKYFTYNDIITVTQGINDDTSRNFIYNVLLDYKNINDVNKYHFQFDIWSIYIRHIIQPSEIFQVEERTKLYIAVGDSMFIVILIQVLD